MTFSPKSAALGLAVLLALAPGLHAQTPAGQITVTGEGRVEVAPDMATISLGVTTGADTAAAAMAANSAQLALVLDNLRKAGIAERDLMTTGLSLNPDWRDSTASGESRIVGYVASNMVTAQVRDLAALGAILDAAVQDGANTLNNVSFGLTDPGPVLDEARRRAVAEAVRRAGLLAGAAGVALGPIRSIREGADYGAPQPMFRADAAPVGAVPVASGSLSMDAQVTIVWDLQP